MAISKAVKCKDICPVEDDAGKFVDIECECEKGHSGMHLGIIRWVNKEDKPND